MILVIQIILNAHLKFNVILSGYIKNAYNPFKDLYVVGTIIAFSGMFHGVYWKVSETFILYPLLAILFVGQFFYMVKGIKQNQEVL